MKDDRLYLIHVQECIQSIETYVAEGRETFIGDGKTQDAVLRKLQILAESSQRLSAAWKDAHTEVDWREIAGLRNVLAHDYLGINLSRIWEIVERDLPDLKTKVQAMLAVLPDKP